MLLEKYAMELAGKLGVEAERVTYKDVINSLNLPPGALADLPQLVAPWLAELLCMVEAQVPQEELTAERLRPFTAVLTNLVLWGVLLGRGYTGES